MTARVKASVRKADRKQTAHERREGRPFKAIESEEPRPKLDPGLGGTKTDDKDEEREEE